MNIEIDLDESCKNYDFCKKYKYIQNFNELLLNLGSRTQGKITPCETCNAYWKKEQKNEHLD